MKHLLLAGALGVALCATAVQAQAKDDKGGGCIRSQDLRNHTVGEDGASLLWNYNGRDVYRVTTDKNCLAAVTSSDPIVLKVRGGSSLICKPIDWDISVRGTHCIVSGMTKLTPAEVAALPKGKRP